MTFDTWLTFYCYCSTLLLHPLITFFLSIKYLSLSIYSFSLSLSSIFSSLPFLKKIESSWEREDEKHHKFFSHSFEPIAKEHDRREKWEIWSKRSVKEEEDQSAKGSNKSTKSSKSTKEGIRRHNKGKEFERLLTFCSSSSHAWIASWKKKMREESKWKEEERKKEEDGSECGEAQDPVQFLFQFQDCIAHSSFSLPLHSHFLPWVHSNALLGPYSHSQLVPCSFIQRNPVLHFHQSLLLVNIALSLSLPRLILLSLSLSRLISLPVSSFSITTQSNCKHSETLYMLFQ